MESSRLIAAQNFMSCMTTMGLSQVVSGPTNLAGHTLDFVFHAGQDDGDLGVEELSVVLLSWTDHHLVGLRLPGTRSLCRGGTPIKIIHHQEADGSKCFPDGSWGVSCCLGR